MNAKEKIQIGKSDGNADLQLAFDVGHSSLGWAVLQTPPDSLQSTINLLGCGVVTFGADDCLASDRRKHRQQRRHIRATRQRIIHLGNFLAGLGVINPQEIQRQHSQGKGNRKGEGRGFSFPWLLAARLLAARPEDRHKHLLTWPELWDVLRWYAHNRGYDENIRWSGDYQIHDVSPAPTITGEYVVKQAEKAEKAEQGEDVEGKEKTDGNDSKEQDTDSDKLKLSAKLMGDYKFLTPTFAETVAKFLLGPDRTVTPGPPGKTGILKETSEQFSKDDFHRLLFGLDERYKNHPRHLKNYFKGLRCSFVRRKVDDGADGKRILGGGTEWEVRTIIRAHFNAPEGKARCDDKFLRMVCGGTPEDQNENERDWCAYRQTHRNSYFLKEEAESLRAQLKQHRFLKGDSIEERRRKRNLRRDLANQAHKGKIVLPKRYRGGLLFGQLVPRLKNRIIAECPITFCRKLRMFSNVLAGLPPYSAPEIPSEGERHQVDAELKEFQRRLAKAKAKGREAKEIAEEYASILAKVPSRNTTEFLNSRWAILLANLKIRKPGDVLPPGEKLRPLTKDERTAVDAKARELGFLRYERAETKKVTRDDGTEETVEKKKEVNDLAKIVATKVFSLPVETADQLQAAMEEIKERTNLDGFFIPSDMRAAFMIVPVKNGGEAFRRVWASLSPWLRRYFTTQLLRGEKLCAEIIRQRLTARIASPNQAKERDAEKREECRVAIRDLEAALRAAATKRGRCEEDKLAKMWHEPFETELLEGRARYHRDVLRQIVREVMDGEDPRKYARRRGMPADKWAKAENKMADGCLVITDDMQLVLDERPIAGQTNNHLVRHRILVLTGNLRPTKDGEIAPRNSLLDDLIEEFAGRDKKKIARITIEVTRDLQEMSSLSNKKKKSLEDTKRQHHTEIADRLAEELKDQSYNGKPIKITPALIKKARIADDLGWMCPYTSTPQSPNIFSAYQLATGAYDLDHVIPRSQRLSNAMEAMVVTSRRINGIKGNRTAMQFVKEMTLPHNQRLKMDLGILSPDQFKALVKSFKTGGASNDDKRRKRKRKELLLVENWNEGEFTPRDLTNTAYVVKLAAQRLRARFRDLPEDERPPVIYVPGSVTSTFRDKGWRAIHELAAVHQPIAEELKKGEVRYKLAFEGNSPKARTATRKDIQAVNDDIESFVEKWRKEILTPEQRNNCQAEIDGLLISAGRLELKERFRFTKSTLNLKATIRGMTHIHHALDAAVLGLVTHSLVPPRNHSLDGKLAKWIVKGSLTNEERDEFRRLYYGMQLGCQFGARRFWGVRFEGRTPDDRARQRDQFLAQCNEELQKLLESESARPFTHAERERFDQLVTELDLPRPFQFDARNRLRIRSLDKAMKKKLHDALRNALQCRVIQHVPKGRSGLALDETVYRVILEQSELETFASRLREDGGGRPTKWPAIEPGHAIIVVRKRKGAPGAKRPGKCLLETNAHWFAWNKIPKRKLFGLPSTAESHPGKLQKQKAVKEISGNFGIALLKHVNNPDHEKELREQGAEVADGNRGEKVFVVLIRQQAVHQRLEDLKRLNGGERPELLRAGMLIDVPNGNHALGRWRVASPKDNADGLALDLRTADGLEIAEQNKKVIRLLNDGLKILKPSLCGNGLKVAPCPTPSSA